MRTFDEPKLIARLRVLPSDARVVFAAACAERMRLVHRRHAERAGRGNGNAFDILLDRLWLDLDGHRMSDADIVKGIEGAMALLPDPDDLGGGMDGAYADDAVSALAYALRCRRAGDPEEAAWAARLVYEALDQYVIVTDDIDTNLAGSEQRILAHSLIQAEFARQDEDLRSLESDAARTRPETVRALRDRAVSAAGGVLPG